MLNLKKILSSVLIFTVVASPAISQVAPPSQPVDQGKARQSAEALSNIMRNQAPVIGADGAVGKKPDGSAQKTLPGRVTAEDQTRLLKNLSGYDSFTGGATPGTSRSAGASVGMKINSTFSCLTAGQIRQAGAITYKINSCEYNSTVAQDPGFNQVKAATLQLCGRGVGTKDCSSGFSTSTRITDTSSATIEGIAVSLNCAQGSRSCKTTFSYSGSVEGTVDQALQKGGQQASTNSTFQDLQKTYLSDQYTEKFKESKTAYGDCFARQQAQRDAGEPITTCDGKQTISTEMAAAIGQTSNPDACNTVFECTQKVKKTVRYSKTCQVAPKTTELQCQYNTPTQTCVRTKSFAYTITKVDNYVAETTIGPDKKPVTTYKYVSTTTTESPDSKDPAARWTPRSDAQPPYFDSCSAEDYRYADWVGDTPWAETDSTSSTTTGSPEQGAVVTTINVKKDYRREIYLAWTKDKSAYPEGFTKYRTLGSCVAKPYRLLTNPIKPSTGLTPADGAGICVLNDNLANYTCSQQKLNPTASSRFLVNGQLAEYTTSVPLENSFFGNTNQAGSCVANFTNVNDLLNPPSFNVYDGGDPYSTKDDISVLQLENEVVDYNSTRSNIRDGGDGSMSMDDSVRGESCGVCKTPTFGYTCLGNVNFPTVPIPQGEEEKEDSCAVMDADPSCQLVSATNTGDLSSQLVDGPGLASAQIRTYSCVKEEEVCAKFERKSSCPISFTGGLDSVYQSKGSLNTESFGQAVANAAMINAIGQGTASGAGADAEFKLPTIFAGKTMGCRRPTDYFSSFLENNCCRTNLERPGGNRPFNQCNVDEVELAAARRAQYTVELGEFCSKTRKFPRRCTERRQTACKFDGLLPKLVQIQGRQQLQQLVMASGNAQVQSQTLTYPYYNSDELRGSWSDPIEVNNNLISVWKEPGYCRRMANGEDMLNFLTDPANENAQECAGSVTTFFAVCDKTKTGGCPAKPGTTDPYEYDVDFQVNFTNPLYDTPTSISKYVLAQGGCDTASEQCVYNVKALPAGQGGKSLQVRPLNFPLSADGTAQTSASLGLNGDVNTANKTQQELQTLLIGDAIVEPIPLAQPITVGQPLPPTIQMRVSLNNGDTWTTFSVPTTAVNDLPVPGTDFKISGTCNSSTAFCYFKLAGLVTVTMKPWGGPTNPDCSGFSVNQLSVLDFGKMDLSEWTQTITNKVNSSITQNDIDAIAQRAATFAGAAETNGSINVAPSVTNANQYARLSPKEFYGPYRATLDISEDVVVGYEDVNGITREKRSPVTGIRVDWADCTTAQSVANVNTLAGSPFDWLTIQRPSISTASGDPTVNASRRYYRLNHVYASPDKLPNGCAIEQSTIHDIKVKLTLANGETKDVEVRASNVFRDFKGTVGKEEGLGGQSSTGANGVQINTAPPPNLR